MSSIVGFLSYKNKYPLSFLEMAGDALLTPVTTLLRRNSFVLLKNETNGNRCIYTHTNDTKSSLRVVVEVIISVVALPLALVGILFKGLSLIFSKKTRDIYLNWKSPHQAVHHNPQKIHNNYAGEPQKWHGIVERGDNIIALMIHVIEQGCEPEWLEEFFSHPRDYLFSQSDSLFGNRILLPPHLQECSCVRSGNFDRFKNQRRVNLEKKLVEDAVNEFPLDTPLNYVGFGAGKLLQDFINVGKLIQAGYRDLKIVLIDPCLKGAIVRQQDGELKFSKEMDQFLMLGGVANRKGIAIEIFAFENITEYRQKFPEERAHIISAVDFDDCDTAFDDITLCHQILHEKGKFHLAYDLYDFCFSATECIHKQQHKGGRKDLMAANFECLRQDVVGLSQKLSQKGEKVVRYAQLGREFKFQEWAGLLPELAKCGCDKIELTWVQPPPRFSLKPKEQVKPVFTKENLEYYLKLFLPKKTKIEVRLVDSVASFKQHVETSKARFDMITWWGYASQEEETTTADIRWLRQHAADSRIYYAVRIYRKGADRFDTSWRWDADLGTQLLSPSNPADVAAIDDMMKGQQQQAQAI